MTQKAALLRGFLVTFIAAGGAATASLSSLPLTDSEKHWILFFIGIGMAGAAALRGFVDQSLTRAQQEDPKLTTGAQMQSQPLPVQPQDLDHQPPPAPPEAPVPVPAPVPTAPPVLTAGQPITFTIQAQPAPQSVQPPQPVPMPLPPVLPIPGGS